MWPGKKSSVGTIDTTDMSNFASATSHGRPEIRSSQARTLPEGYTRLPTGDTGPRCRQSSAGACEKENAGCSYGAAYKVEEAPAGPCHGWLWPNQTYRLPWELGNGNGRDEHVAGFDFAGCRLVMLTYLGYLDT